MNSAATTPTPTHPPPAPAPPAAASSSSVSRANDHLRAHLHRSRESADAAMAQHLVAHGMPTPAAAAAARPNTNNTNGGMFARHANLTFDPWQTDRMIFASQVQSSAPLPPPVMPTYNHLTPACSACGSTGNKNRQNTHKQKEQKDTQHSPLSRCSGCRAVFYCGKTCQRNDWKKHKWLCRHVRTMDMHQMNYLKISSTTPGNFHRVVQSVEVEAAEIAASLGIVAPSSSQFGIGSGIHVPSSNVTPHASSTYSTSHASIGPIISPTTRPPTSATKRARSNSSISAVHPSSSSSTGVASQASMDFLAASSSDSEEGEDAEGQDEDETMGQPTRKKAKRQANPHPSVPTTSNSNDGSAPMEICPAPSSSVFHECKQAPPVAVPAPESSSSHSVDASSSTAAAAAAAATTAPLVPLQLCPMVLRSDGTFMSRHPETIRMRYGPQPQIGQTCLLFFQGRHGNGQVFTKNRDVFFNGSASSVPSRAALSPSALEWISEMDGSTPLSFSLGLGEVIESWDRCVAKMFKGETAIILTRDETRQVYIYELTLVDFW